METYYLYMIRTCVLKIQDIKLLRKLLHCCVNLYSSNCYFVAFLKPRMFQVQLVFGLGQFE